MQPLMPLKEIFVPDPRPDETYRIRLFDRDYAFAGLKALLGGADFSKARVGSSVFSELDLSSATGLETVHHNAPSSLESIRFISVRE